MKISEIKPYPKNAKKHNQKQVDLVANSIQETKPKKSVDTELKQKKRRGAPPEFLFKKGQSGNPAGRPEGTFSLLTLLKQELQKCPEGQDKKTYADLIVKRMLKEAIEKGDQQQIKLIWNYIEGMPKQGFDFNGNPLLVQVIFPPDGNKENLPFPKTSTDNKSAAEV